jgi:hypothetical protein
VNYYGLTSLFNGIVVLCVGFFLLSRQWQNRLYQSFATFSTSVGLWCVFYSFWQIQADQIAALFFIRRHGFLLFHSVRFLFVLKLQVDLVVLGVNGILAIPLFFCLVSVR